MKPKFDYLRLSFQSYIVQKEGIPCSFYEEKSLIAK